MFSHVLALGLALLNFLQTGAAPNPASGAKATVQAEFSGRSVSETNLSYAMLGFGALVVVSIVAVLIRKNQGFGPQTVRLLLITLVITAGAFLITAGYSNDQMAPMYALLGTIAGFVLKDITAKDK